MNKILKKSNVVSTIIFFTAFFSVFINYLMLKTKIDYYKTKYETNKQIIENLDNKCFKVEKAYVIPRKREYEVLIYLPYKIVPKNEIDKIIVINNIPYYLKKMKKIKIDDKTINKPLILKNIQICEE